jgi:hypothetical protein
VNRPKIAGRIPDLRGLSATKGLSQSRPARVATIFLIAFGPLVFLLASGFTGFGPRAASAATVPGWEPDANSVGSITFTDASGAPVSGGSLNSPLAAFAVGAHVGGASDTQGQLYMYAPIQGLDPGNWQGDVLGLSATYIPAPSSLPATLAPLADAGLPVVPEAPNDETPAGMITDFPGPTKATDPGYADLYEVRLYTTGDGLGLSQRYDSADISVDQTTGKWALVYPASAVLPTASLSPSTSTSTSTSPTPTPTPTPSPTPSASPSPTASPSPSPTPTPTPSPSASSITATDSSGNVLTTDPNLAPGDTVTLAATGFTAGESVGAVLHSTPQTLASANADSSGDLSYTFTVPSALPDGSHSVMFTGATSDVVETWIFTVGDASPSTSPSVLGETLTNTDDPTTGTSTTLPFTGTNVGRPLVLGIAALWSGLILILLGRPWAPLVPGNGRHRQGTSLPAGFGRHHAG